MRNRMLIPTLTILLAACATVPLTGRRQVSMVPASDMLVLGAETYAGILGEARLSTDEQQIGQLQQVGTRIAAAAEELMAESGLAADAAKYNWEFALIDDDEMVNAFCLPGGKIAVYSGILPVTADETGLAVVVGHEVAHALANHGGERMSQLLLVQLGGAALSVALESEPSQTRQLVELAYGVGANVGVMLPYSRSHESEADYIGLILMARAGYDPRQAAPFWERMDSGGGSRPPTFLSTHPQPAQRSQDLEARLPEAMEEYRAP